MKRKWRNYLLVLVLASCLGFGAYLIYDTFFSENYSELTENVQSLSSQVEDLTAEKVTKLDVGKVYQAYSAFKLVDDSHFVFLYDNSEYSEEDLEEAREEAESGDIYPSIWMGEGIYKKVGDDYYFLTKREVKIKFESVQKVKKKEYFELTEEHLEAIDYTDKPQLIKKKGSYSYRYAQYSLNANKTTTETGTVLTGNVLLSDQKIESNVEAFLAHYKKAERN